MRAERGGGNARTEMPPDGHAAAALFALAVATVLRAHLAAREVARREVEVRRVERHEPREQHVVRHLGLKRAEPLYERISSTTRGEFPHFELPER